MDATSGMALSPFNLWVLAVWSLLAWSILTFILGRVVGVGEAPDPDRDGGVLIPLIAVLGSLTLILAWEDGTMLGVPNMVVAAIAFVAAYSVLLFEVGQGR